MSFYSIKHFHDKRIEKVFSDAVESWLEEETINGKVLYHDLPLRPIEITDDLQKQLDGSDPVICPITYALMENDFNSLLLRETRQGKRPKINDDDLEEQRRFKPTPFFQVLVLFELSGKEPGLKNYLTRRADILNDKDCSILSDNIVDNTINFAKKVLSYTLDLTCAKDSRTLRFNTPDEIIKKNHLMYDKTTKAGRQSLEIQRMAYTAWIIGHRGSEAEVPDWYETYRTVGKMAHDHEYYDRPMTCNFDWAKRPDRRRL